MRVVTDDRVVAFVGERCGGFLLPYTAMGVEIDGTIAGGIVFNRFGAFDCHMTVASEHGRPWPKGFLADVGRYLFDQLKRERVTALTEQPRVVSIALRLGGKVEGVLRNYYGPGRDATLVGILKDEWRY